MPDNDNLPSFLANEIIQVKKDKTWVWVLVAFLVLCLCLTVIAVGVGVYLYINRPADPTPAPPIAAPTMRPPPTVVPEPTARPLPTEAPAPPLSLEIEYFDFSEGIYYEDLRSLVYGYGDSETPGEDYWEATVIYTQTVLVSSGWCTTTTEVLDQNFEHITYTWVADGVAVDMSTMYKTDEFQVDRYCRVFNGLIRLWPLGDHEIIIDMVFDAPINDGWDTYPAGHYTDIYTITVVR